MLLPLVVAGILLLPTPGVAVILAAVFLVGAAEWVRLVRPGSKPASALFVLAAAGAFWVLGQLADAPPWPSLILLAVLAWWVGAIALVGYFPRGWAASVGSAPVGLALGLLVLGGAFIALLLLHARGPGWMLSLFALIWVTDSGAYFVGRAWGRHKLAPRISPGKTREGAAGGVALAALTALPLAWVLGYAGAQLAAFVLLAGLTAAVSIVGDLAISMFKRRAGIKDSGSLFPGHGGVLDRLDSLLAAAPVFAAGLIWWLG